MPTKPLDRLFFIQGGVCFFCKQPLPKAEASVEHLHARANGGDNRDENCVVCCKTVNAWLGSISLKEKFQVVLNQKGSFKCPNGAGSTNVAEKPNGHGKCAAPDDETCHARFPLSNFPPNARETFGQAPAGERANESLREFHVKAQVIAKPKDDKLVLVVANLKQRGNSRPRTLKTLTSTVSSLFPHGLPEAELAALVQQLQSSGKVTVIGSKVTYAL